MPRVWFVTGASRGLGHAIVEAALQAGDFAVATARNSAQLLSLVQTYGSDKVLPLQVDVTNHAQVDEAIAYTIKKFGHLDVLVNNAGYANVNSVEHMPLEDFRQQFETDFFGTVYTSKAVIPIMRKQGSGLIIQISSIGGRVGSPGLSAYQSAKWAIGGFSTALQGEVASFGINVIVCEPGGMKTDWAGSSMSVAPVTEGYEPTIGASIEYRKKLLPTWSGPEDIARSILYISKAPEPPLRLLLGPDTRGYAEAAAEQLAKDDQKWMQVTMLQA